jgi:hypothetical protein
MRIVIEVMDQRPCLDFSFCCCCFFGGRLAATDGKTHSDDFVVGINK